MKKIVILTGAGISAESGIKTFRDADGLWENHDVMEVASPQGWEKNRALVLRFYNDRRNHLKDVHPNAAHKALAELESKYKVVVITQNVDDLHERGGSSNIIHLHGELTKMRSVMDDTVIYDCTEDINVGDKAKDGYQLRPHIVWFGEMVPMLEVAAKEVMSADIVMVIGSSMQVYPAAGLVEYAPDNIPVYYIDPKPTINYELGRSNNLIVMEENATTGVRKVVDELMG